MRTVRHADQRVLPWKNGLGHTRELLVHPPGADLDAFALRLSLASVVADGPFSAFPGVDRWICVLSGAGMDLDVDGAALALDPGTGARFAGEARTVGTLRDGPVTDLNVMARRPWAADCTLGPVDTLVADGPTAVWGAEGRLGPLEAGDAAWLDAGERLDGHARALVARVRAAG